MENKKKVLIVTPSVVIARGFEMIFSNAGEFKVYGIISDLSGGSDLRLRSSEPDVIIVDPAIFDYASRQNIRAFMPENPEVAIVSLRSVIMSDDEMRQYDDSISMYDAPAVIIKKLRAAVSAIQEEAPKSEGEELSLREKEILVCVAKGMINKEIADYFNLSIYTVITHRKNITRKTGLKSVAALTMYAYFNNLIDKDSLE